MGNMFVVRDDVEAEVAMSDRGIKWSIETIALNQIDWTQSNVNCGRLKKFTDAQTQQMRDDKAKGDTFPRCIVAATANKKYLIVSGWNRLQADRSAGATHAQVYVIADDAVVNQVLAAETNSKHGIGIDRQQKTALAVAWMQKNGSSGAQADKAFNLPAGSCADFIKHGEVARAMIASGVNKNVVEKASLAHLDELGRLANKPTILRHIATQMDQHKWTAKELSTVAKAVSNFEDTNKCDQTIKGLGLARKSEVRFEVARPHQRRIMQAVSQVANLENLVVTRAASQLTEESMAILKDLLPKAGAVLAQLKSLLT